MVGLEKLEQLWELLGLLVEAVVVLHECFWKKSLRGTGEGALFCFLRVKLWWNLQLGELQWGIA